MFYVNQCWSMLYRLNSSRHNTGLFPHNLNLQPRLFHQGGISGASHYARLNYPKITQFTINSNIIHDKVNTCEVLTVYYKTKTFKAKLKLSSSLDVCPQISI